MHLMKNYKKFRQKMIKLENQKSNMMINLGNYREREKSGRNRKLMKNKNLNCL